MTQIKMTSPVPSGTYAPATIRSSNTNSTGPSSIVNYPIIPMQRTDAVGTITSTSVQSTGQGTNYWTAASVHSANMALTASAYTTTAAGTYFGFGRNASPPNDGFHAAYWYCNGNGTICAYYASTAIGMSAGGVSFGNTDQMIITYDGTYYRFYKNTILYGSASVPSDTYTYPFFYTNNTNGSGWQNIAYNSLTASAGAALPETFIRIR